MNSGNSIYDQSVISSSSHEFHHLPSVTSMTLHQNDTTTRVSTDTLINDEHNNSFEDEDMGDEHLTAVDHTDSEHKQQTNGGTIVKASALYDFNGKKKKRSLIET
jgi:hypothetical protein